MNRSASIENLLEAEFEFVLGDPHARLTDEKCISLGIPLVFKRVLLRMWPLDSEGRPLTVKPPASVSKSASFSTRRVLKLSQQQHDAEMSRSSSGGSLESDAVPLPSPSKRSHAYHDDDADDDDDDDDDSDELVDEPEDILSTGPKSEMLVRDLDALLIDSADHISPAKAAIAPAAEIVAGTSAAAPTAESGSLEATELAGEAAANDAFPSGSEPDLGEVVDIVWRETAPLQPSTTSVAAFQTAHDDEPDTADKEKIHGLACGSADSSGISLPDDAIGAPDLTAPVRPPLPDAGTAATPPEEVGEVFALHQNEWGRRMLVHGFGNGAAGQLGIGNLSHFSPKVVSKQSMVKPIVVPVLSDALPHHAPSKPDPSGSVKVHGTAGNTTGNTQRRLRSLAGGVAHSAAVAETGEVWCCGQGEAGQLGWPDRLNRFEFTKVPNFPGSARVVACGRRATAVIDVNGDVWGWGDGFYVNNVDDLGNLVESSEQRCKPRKIETFPTFSRSRATPFRILSLSLGDEHILSLSSDGRIYAWGNNKYGQCGVGHTDPVPVPTVVETLAHLQVVSISASGDQSCCITSDGEMYIWGWRLETSVSTSVLLAARALGEIFSDETEETYCELPLRVEVGGGERERERERERDGGREVLVQRAEREMEREKAKERDFGSPDVQRGLLSALTHSVWSTASSLLTSGGRPRPQPPSLSLPQTSDSLSPSLSLSLSRFVIAIASGKYHSAALTATGALYVWGRLPRLKHPNEWQDLYTPTRVKLSGVLHVEQTSVIGVIRERAVALDAAGRGSEEPLDTSGLYDSLPALPERIVQIACGWCSVIILTSLGRIIRVDAVSEKGTEWQCHDVAGELSMTGHFVKHIACGGLHTFAVDHYWTSLLLRAQRDHLSISGDEIRALNEYLHHLPVGNVHWMLQMCEDVSLHHYEFGTLQLGSESQPSRKRSLFSRSKVTRHSLRSDPVVDVFPLLIHMNSHRDPVKLHRPVHGYICVRNVSLKEAKVRVLQPPEASTHVIRITPVSVVLKKNEHVFISVELIFRFPHAVRKFLYIDVEGGLRHRVLLAVQPASPVDAVQKLNHSEIQYGDVIGDPGGSWASVRQAHWRDVVVVVKKWDTSRVAMAQRAADAVLQEFWREVGIFSTLRHRNIVQFMGACVEEPNLCIVVEFCSRGSLFSLLHSDPQALQKQPKLLLGMAVDVARGVRYLHKNHIIHRDLKSGNLLIDENWTVKVTDFGVSRQLSVETMKNQAHLTMHVGTTHWMAPEVIVGDEYSDKADVYSFAIVLFEMWMGTPPYMGLSRFQIEDFVVKGGRPALPPNCPAFLRHLITRCWAAKPEDRPSFEGVVRYLEAVQKDISSGTLNL